MVSAESGSTSNLLTQFMKTKGCKTIGDDDDVEELMQLLAAHELIIHVEHCITRRPSRTGSLRGSAEKYEQHFSDLQAAMGPLQGAGRLSVLANHQDHAPVSSSLAMGALSPVPKAPKRPGSANPAMRRTAPLQNLWVQEGGASQRVGCRSFPGIGAFEVAYTLRNTETGASYGPELVYSKLLSRQWPNPGKLRKTIGHSLQPLLKKDQSNSAFQQAIIAPHSLPPPCATTSAARCARARARTASALRDADARLARAQSVKDTISSSPSR